jgi:hypothetical protein
MLCRHLDAPAANGSVKTRFWFEKEKSVNPGERIDAFAFFYCPDAVLAKTVLASRRSRAAGGGICFSADRFVPRSSQPLLFGNEHPSGAERTWPARFAEA